MDLSNIQVVAQDFTSKRPEDRMSGLFFLTKLFLSLEVGPVLHGPLLLSTQALSTHYYLPAMNYD